MGRNVSTPNETHDNWGETRHTLKAKEKADSYRNETNKNLNSLISEIDQNRIKIQNDALTKEMEYLTKLMMIDWQLYEQKIAISQAKMVATTYTNKIIGELRILKSVLEA
jgi:hypothetical protein